MVRHSTELGNPAPRAACRAGAWPSPAGNTFPIITSSILSVGTLDFFRTESIANDPNFGAEMFAKLP